MAVGPIQLLVLGFDKPQFEGDVVRQIRRLADEDSVRLIDSLTVFKDANGETAVVQANTLTPEHAGEVGAVIGGLIGLGGAGGEGAVEGVLAGAAAMESGEGVFSAEQAREIVEDIPPNSAAALLLLEHRWAIPLRDAIVQAGGFRITDGFLSPKDLIEVGLAAAEEADALAAWEAPR
ncbi:MAG TPA: hypothetical protein VEX15_18960 [Nocardioidaceae bacterium]|nr:hypothetical protein [Nocardioidaceae bacterium]